MQHSRSFFWQNLHTGLPSLLVASVITVGLLACTPAATSGPSGGPALTPTLDLPMPATASVTRAALANATPESAGAPALAVATSRGPDLEATNPAAVELASGQLQLIEFFRFT